MRLCTGKKKKKTTAVISHCYLPNHREESSASSPPPPASSPAATALPVDNSTVRSRRRKGKQRRTELKKNTEKKRKKGRPPLKPLLRPPPPAPPRIRCREGRTLLKEGTKETKRRSNAFAKGKKKRKQLLSSSFLATATVRTTVSPRRLPLHRHQHHCECSPSHFAPFCSTSRYAFYVSVHVISFGIFIVQVNYNSLEQYYLHINEHARVSRAFCFPRRVTGLGQ